MKQPLRIFFPGAPITYPPTDGHHVHIYQLVKNLRARGHTIRTITPDQNPEADVRSRSPLAVAQHLRWADVLYIRPAEIPVMPATLTALPFRLLIPRRTAVVWEQNRALTVSLLKNKRSEADIQRHLRIFRRLARRVDAAIGVTDLVTHQLRDLLGITHSVTIQNGSDPHMFRPDLPPPRGLERGANDPLRIAWIGSHSNSVHDADLIASAAQIIDQEAQPLQLHIIGRTQDMFPQPRPRSLVLHGPVSYHDLPAFLAAMDVGLTLYNYRADGVSPLKLFDYLASGCVPICSPGQPMEQVLSGSDAGFIDEWTPQKLVRCLRLLHNDPHRRLAMRERGRRLIENTYNWGQVARLVESVIRDAIARRRS